MNYISKKALLGAAVAIVAGAASIPAAQAIDFQPHPSASPPAWTQPAPAGPSAPGGGGWVRPTPGDSSGGGAGVVGGYEGRSGSVGGSYRQPEHGSGYGEVHGSQDF